MNVSGVDVVKNALKNHIWLVLGNGTKVEIIKFLTSVQGTKVNK